MSDDGGPAFPWGEHGNHLGGMSLRDWFAGQVIQQSISLSSDRDGGWSAYTAAECAYMIADAMLKARAS